MYRSKTVYVSHIIGNGSNISTRLRATLYLRPTILEGPLFKEKSKVDAKFSEKNSHLNFFIARSCETYREPIIIKIIPRQHEGGNKKINNFHNKVFLLREWLDFYAFCTKKRKKWMWKMFSAAQITSLCHSEKIYFIEMFSRWESCFDTSKGFAF